MALTTSSQPLHGIRIVDFTQGIAGPYCSKLLADFGAEVIKIEKPGVGDYARLLGPFPNDIPDNEKSGTFLFLNGNKRTVTLDLSQEEDRTTALDLISTSHLVLESFRPGAMKTFGLDYETLSKKWPNLVFTSITNFGQTGPYSQYSASELVLFAMGGNMHASGLPDRYPLKLGGNHVQFQAGNVAAMASLFALYARDHVSLGGQHIDVSIFETQMASINQRMRGLLAYQYTGERTRRTVGLGNGYPTGYYPCADGYISLVGGGPFWPRTVKLLGMPELLDNPRFAPPYGQLDVDAREEFETEIWLPWCLSRTKLDAVAELQAAEIFSGAVNTLDDVITDNPQLEARGGYFVELEHPIAGSLKYPGAPMLIEEPWWSAKTPAPTKGQHDSLLTHTLNPWTSGTENPEQSLEITKTENRKKPLDGIRIIDMTVVWAGPYATMFLADMGAEVIRVEPLNIFPSTTRGQMARPNKDVEQQSPAPNYPDRDPGTRPWNRFAIFNLHARNKYSMTADLNTLEGKETFRKLVETSDLFIENNAVGSIERLGLTYPTLRQWNPRLSMISSTGFGQTGPWNTYRGLGLHFEAAFGHCATIGYPDMDADGIPGSVAADAVTGVTIAMGAVMSLMNRDKTGKGTYIDVSMGENFLPHLGELVMDYMINGRVATAQGNRDPWYVQGVYQCTGDDEWIAITLGSTKQWQTLCQAISKPELALDERFDSLAKMFSHHDLVDEKLSNWAKTIDVDTAFHLLQEAGISAGPLLNEPRAFMDPHLRARDFFVEIDAPEVGTHLYAGSPFKLSKVPLEIMKPPVRLGEDNEYIYKTVLGITDEAYAHLESLGQIGMDYHPHVA